MQALWILSVKVVSINYTRFFKEVGFIEEHLTSILALCKGEFEQACPTKSSHLCKTLCKGSQGDQCMLKC